MVAKKVISSMYEYYCMIQLLLLINLNCNFQIPASADLLLSTINGIVNLSSFDKQELANTLHIPTGYGLLKENSLLSNLGGIAIVAIALPLVITIVLILGLVLRTKKAQELIQKIKNYC